MAIVYATLLTAVYVISWVYYTKYQLIERRLPDAEEEVNLIPTKLWHKWKFVNQIAFFGMSALAAGFFNSCILAIVYWITFDALTATVVLSKEYYYLGGTAEMDKYFKGKISEKTFFYLRCVLAVALIAVKLLFKL